LCAHLAAVCCLLVPFGGCRGTFLAPLTSPFPSLAVARGPIWALWALWLRCSKPGRFCYTSEGHALCPNWGPKGADRHPLGPFWALWALRLRCSKPGRFCYTSEGHALRPNWDPKRPIWAAFGADWLPKVRFCCRFGSLLRPFGPLLGSSWLFGPLVWPFAGGLAIGSQRLLVNVGTWGLCCPSAGGLATRLGGCFPLSPAGLLSLFLGVRPLEWEDAPFSLL